MHGERGLLTQHAASHVVLECEVEPVVVIHQPLLLTGVNPQHPHMKGDDPRSPLMQGDNPKQHPQPPLLKDNPQLHLINKDNPQLHLINKDNPQHPLLDKENLAWDRRWK